MEEERAAAEVFLDPYHVSVQDRHVRGESRWQTTGFIESRGFLLLLVAHTMEAIDDEGEEYEYIRIISARKADREAKERYEAGGD